MLKKAGNKWGLIFSERGRASFKIGLMAMLGEGRVKQEVRYSWPQISFLQNVELHFGPGV